METIENFAKSWNPTTRLVERDGGRTSLRESLQYSLLLLRRDKADDRRRAGDVVEALLGMQRMTPDWDRGRFPMRIDDSWRDLNANLFMAPGLLEIDSEHVHKLAPSLAGRFREAVRLAMSFAERRWEDEIFDLHRDGIGYSNIIALYIQFLFLAGLHYRDERLLRAGRAQWRRWFNHISYYGIDEFVSVTYNGVVLEALVRLHGMAIEPSVRFEINLVLDHLMMLQYAIAHPVLRLPVCGTSRDYRLFSEPGKGEFIGIASPDSLDGYRVPSAVAAEYAQRQFPHRVAGRATAVPFRFKSWQSERSGLGTMTGGHYFPQQINLFAVVGNGPMERAVAFLPGGTGWNTSNGYVCQSDHEALCVFARSTNSYYRTQVPKPDNLFPAAESLQHGFGITAGWREESNVDGRLVLSAFDHVLDVRPFVISGSRLMPIRLERKSVKNVFSGVETDGFLFPDDARWFGCRVTLARTGDARVDIRLSASMTDHIVTVGDGRLTIRLCQQPAGELTELYADDWRIAPLLEGPVGLLWPGELTQKAAHRDL